MRVLFIQEYSAKTQKGDTRTVAAGAVLDLSPDKATRLITLGVVVEFEPVVSAWRDYMSAADMIFRRSPKSVDAWQQHKKELNAAEALFAKGYTPEAGNHLKKALTALQGLSMTQTELSI